MMGQDTIYLDISSPSELSDKLKAIPKGKKGEGEYVVVNLSGKQVIVRNFELPVSSLKEIKSALLFEAVESLSLKPEEVEIDYQIFNSTEGKSKGVFLAMPKASLKEYYEEIGKHGFIPAAFTSKMLTVINEVFSRVPFSTQAFYLLSFIDGKNAFLALFNEGRCELLRDIYYDDINEAKNEISNSLRYALGKSAAKHPEELYFSGEIEGRDELISNLEHEFNVKSKVVDLNTEEPKIADVKGYFKLNLISKYSVSLSLRRKLYRYFNFALLVFLFIFVFSFIGWVKSGANVRKLKKEFHSVAGAAEYTSKIKELQKKIKLLENEK